MVRARTRGEEISWKLVKRGDRKFYAFRYRLGDGRWRERSTGCSRKREAERFARELLMEGQLDRELHGWREFRRRYEAEHLSGQAAKTAEAFSTAANRLEDLCDVRVLGDIDASCLVRFALRLREEGKSEATIQAYRSHLMSALGWAEEVGLINERPRVPKLGRVPVGGRGRALTREECERFVMQLPKVVGQEYSSRWAWNVEGLLRSGLRLGETFSLGWSEGYGEHYLVDLDGSYPKIAISQGHEKGFRDRLLPIAPDFVNLLRGVEERQRRGKVFRWTLSRGDSQSVKTVGKRLSACGRRAGIVVGKKRDGSPKYATAHDFRRTFGAYWSTKVMPVVLREIMRHGSIETTMKYYVGSDANRTAEVLRAAVEGGGVGMLGGTEVTLAEETGLEPATD